MSNDKFLTFAALHVPGDPVLLYNVWDAASAKAVVAAGAKAIATGSHPVADANGWLDGEKVPIDFALANAARIVTATDLPVTVDFEGAYSADPEEGAANASRLAATGAVGCNFEDQIIDGEGLHPVSVQVRRIKAIRRAVGGAFFINARTDIFLKHRPEAHDRTLLNMAIERARAYADAGASGFFAPRLGDLQLAEDLVKASPIPINVISFPGGPNRRQWTGVGIARISHGPYPHRELMKRLEESARAAMAE